MHLQLLQLADQDLLADKGILVLAPLIGALLARLEQEVNAFEGHHQTVDVVGLQDLAECLKDAALHEVPGLLASRMHCRI